MSPLDTLHSSQNITMSLTPTLPSNNLTPSNNSMTSHNIITSSSFTVPSNPLPPPLDISQSLDSSSIPVAHPSTLALDPFPLDSPLPLRQSSCLRFTTLRDATRDGLLPDSRLAAAISDVNASVAHTQATHDVGPVDPIHAFLAEFTPFCDSHDLLPLNVTSTAATSVPDLVAAIVDGSLEPELEDEPKWHSALQSPKREYWIARGHNEVYSL